jgi:hypothetical protein
MSTQPAVTPQSSGGPQPPISSPQTTVQPTAASALTAPPTVSGRPVSSHLAHLLPTHISVTFKIVTPDQMRRIIFTLNKVTEDETDSWTVMFELDERADTESDFQLVIQLQVELDETTNEQSAATAKHGLDGDQRAQALTAGDTAKDAKNGDATVDDAKEDAAGIVTSRDPDSPQ